jgi:hypothetical protein
MRINKSTRHAKILGNFGENLVCNWLSRSGFEVTIVDHTGIDVVAYNPKLKQRLGISVRSRARLPGKETDSVYILRKSADDRKKVTTACRAFACEPWVAVYVESTTEADLFLASSVNYDHEYRVRGVIDRWFLSPKAMRKYAADSNVMHLHFSFRDENWW